MITLGNEKIVDISVGNDLAMVASVGDEILFPKRNIDTLVRDVDLIGGTGIELISGIQTTMQNVVHTGKGMKFNGTTSKIFWDGGASPLEYTLFNTFTVDEFKGSHPRLSGEHPLHTMTLHSGNQYAIGFWGPNKDSVFPKKVAPKVKETVQFAFRYSPTTRLLELFRNGVKVDEMTNIQQADNVIRKFIGCRTANDRTFTGEIHEHFIHDVALTDKDLYNEFLVSQIKCGIA